MHCWPCVARLGMRNGVEANTMRNVIDILEERGFIDNKTHEQELRDYLESGPATCYIGFDPTASSLHIGSLVPIMALAHMQRQGHRPIALVGGGTGMVGDPSGKTEMRQILTIADVNENADALKRQLSRFIDFGDDKALLVNNAEWLTRIEYIPFFAGLWPPFQYQSHAQGRELPHAAGIRGRPQFYRIQLYAAAGL